MCRFPKILNTAVSITVFLTAAALSAGCNDDSATNDPVKIVAPAAPTDLTASAVTSSKVALAWQDASSDEGGFYVERKPESGEFGRIAALPSNTTAWTDSGLAPGTFAYRIAAFRDTLVSAWSNEVTVTLKAAEKTAIIADHATADLSLIPSEWIDAAKTKLHNRLRPYIPRQPDHHRHAGARSVEGFEVRVQQERDQRRARPPRYAVHRGIRPRQPGPHIMGSRHEDLPRRQPDGQRSHVVLVRAGVRRLRREHRQLSLAHVRSRKGLPGGEVRLHDRAPRRHRAHRQPPPPE